MNAVILNNLSRLTRWNFTRCQNVSFCSKSKEEPTFPVNPLADVYSAGNQSSNGKMYDNKPFRIRCEAGKIYHWCLCGHSKHQPFCDGTHKNVGLAIKLRPIRFTVTETKEYWLCNCKQTLHRPFCDGTHKSLDVYKIKPSKNT